MNFISSPPFTSLSFPSSTPPHIFPPSFQVPLSLTQETSWWFSDREADFRSVYRQDLRKTTSDKQIPWIHKTSRYISSETAPRRIRPKRYYPGKDVSWEFKSNECTWMCVSLTVSTLSKMTTCVEIVLVTLPKRAKKLPNTWPSCFSAFNLVFLFQIT